MNGSITLCKQYNENTSTYMVIGFYDTWKEQQNAIKSLVKLMIDGKNDVVSINTYTRQDGYKSTYITIK